MGASGLQMEHALESIAIMRTIRMALRPQSEGWQECSEEIDSLVESIEGILQRTRHEYLPGEWRIMVAGLRVLASQYACVAIAQGGEGNLIAERARCDVLMAELRRLLLPQSLALPDCTDPHRRSLLEKGQSNSDTLRAFLLSVPLPTLYWGAGDTDIPGRERITRAEIEPTPMLRVIVFLDHAPVAGPQLLKPNLLYPLVFRVRGLIWPADAVGLRLTLLTTCPASEFSVSELAMDSPTHIENGEYHGDLAGQLKFNSSQSSLLDDLVFTVCGAFATADGSFREVPIIGHSVLRFRVVDEDTHPLMTGNRRLDRHIEELVTKLLSERPKVRDEMPELLDMLLALTRLLATYSQEAIYKGQRSVAEQEFQAMILRDLRFVLGQDVQEHPNQAGGVTDIRYRGVVVELKVEKENADREHLSKKYTGQPVQYAGVEARQVSILLVLDLTTKDRPPGDIRNDILLADVETHGGEHGAKQFPSKVFVFVVNGNIKRPSSYSR